METYINNLLYYFTTVFVPTYKEEITSFLSNNEMVVFYLFVLLFFVKIFIDKILNFKKVRL